MELFSIVIACLVFNAVKILYNIYFWFLVPAENINAMRLTYIMEIMNSVSMGLLFWGFLMVLNNKLDPSFLIFLSIIHIIMMFVRMILSAMVPNAYVQLPVFNFFESFQILYICLKLANPSGHANWSTVLLFYKIVLYFFAFLIIFLTLTLIVVVCF